MAPPEADIIRIRARGGLERKRLGYLHTHRFQLVESCDCCGTQLDLFSATVEDAPMPDLAQEG